MTLKIRMIDHRRQRGYRGADLPVFIRSCRPGAGDMPVQREGSSTGLPQRTVSSFPMRC